MPQKGSGIMYIASPAKANRYTIERPDFEGVVEEPVSRKKKIPASRLIPEDWTKSIRWVLLVLFPIFTVVAYLAKELHYNLPKPVLESYSTDGRPIVSEPSIIRYVQALEDIGYRIVGLDAEVEGEEYVYREMEKLLHKCEASEVLECTLWMQEGDGMHQFDIMDHAVLKSYRGIRNVIFRVNGINTTTTLEGDVMQNSVLLNSHIDSALPSKGSADDGIGVGVMMEVARILVERDDPITGGAVFLFNGAEETLQDASHMYSTQHETRHAIRTVINLEAAGTTGAALCFQATSNEMINAYADAPRPHGNVIAFEVFESGILMSDTDFVQFAKYLGISGLDFSLVGNSYYYHTHRDLVENIEIGSAQHFGDSVLAVLDHLLKPGSSLNIDTPWDPKPNLVYFSLYDRIYLRYTLKTAHIMWGVTSLVAAIFFFATTPGHQRKEYYKKFASPALDLLTALVSSIVVAVFLRYGLGKGQTWFSHEHLALVVFGIPAVTGIIARHYLFVKKTSVIDLERITAFASVFYYLTVTFLLHMFKIKSGYIFFNLGLFGMVGLIMSEVVSRLNGNKGRLSFTVVYIFWTALNITMGIEAISAFLDIFVPLVGRMGRDAPGEIMVAGIVGFLVHHFMPTLAPLYHSFDRDQQKRIVGVLLLITLSSTALFASPAWKAYDATHPKRTGVQYLYNITSGQTTLHVAQLDSGPGYAEFVNKIHEKYGLATLPPVKGGPEQWDILYPISAFIESENFPIVADPVIIEEGSPLVEITLVADRFDEVSGYRMLTVNVAHPGVVSPVLTFSAEVIAWSFRIAPPVGDVRHYVKASASPGNEDFQLMMTIKPQPEREDHKLAIGYMGIDKRQMFPHTSGKRPDLPANAMFTDMNAWIQDEWKGSMEVLMYGAVCGVVEV